MFESRVADRRPPRRGATPPIALGLVIEAFHHAGFSDEAVTRIIDQHCLAGTLVIPRVEGTVNAEYVRTRDGSVDPSAPRRIGDTPWAIYYPLTFARSGFTTPPPPAGARHDGAMYTDHRAPRHLARRRSPDGDT